jgi:hypothetical protein
MDIPPELLECLQQLNDNPLTRLSYEKEQQLIGLGLIRRWAAFVSITEAGRAVLQEAGKNTGAG